MLYCLLRLGRHATAEEALEKAAHLDPSDRFGAARLLSLLRAPEQDEDDE